MTQTLNISLPSELVAQIDKKAKAEFASRSDLLRYALVRYLKHEEAWEELLKNAQKLSEQSKLKTDEEVASYFTAIRRQDAQR